MVPGDVALLAAGNVIPCDGRVLEAKDFFVNQALLTGEPFPVEKAPGELPGEPDILSGRQHRAFGDIGDQRHGKSADVPHRTKYGAR